MKLKAFSRVEDPKTVLLALKEQDDGGVAVVVVDECGSTLNKICTFRADGTLSLTGHVDEKFGFQLVERSKIRTV